MLIKSIGALFLMVTLNIFFAGSRAWANGDDAPGEVVDVGGGLNMHYIFKKANASELPTIVFEGGRGEGSLEWELVKAELPKTLSTFSYDRAGYGWSAESTKERTAENIANELKQLLDKVEIKHIILVGHSSGGVYARVFADKYPDMVKGLVLVDSTNEKMFDNNPKLKKAFMAQARENSTLETFANIGLVAMVFPYIPIGKPALAKFELEIQDKMASKMVIPQFYRTMRKEMEELNRSFKQLKDLDYMWNILYRKRGCPDNTIIIHAGKEVDEKGKELQKDLFKRCSRQQEPLIAEHSGHNIQRDQPKIIASAIRALF